MTPGLYRVWFCHRQTGVEEAVRVAATTQREAAEWAHSDYDAEEWTLARVEALPTLLSKPTPRRRTYQVVVAARL